MIKAIFKAGPKKGGFVATTLAPVNDKQDTGFRVRDGAMFAGLVLGVIAVMRYFLAH